MSIQSHAQPGFENTFNYIESVEKRERKRKLYKIIIFCLQMALYMARWQLSTLVMTPIILIAKHFGVVSSWEQVFWANLFGAIPFFFIDKFIFVNLRKHIQKAIDYYKAKKAA